MTPGRLDPRRSILSGLLGQGIKPSLTPEMHEREAGRHGLRYVYKIIDLHDDELRPDRLRQLLDSTIRLGFDGLNVTHPVKQPMVSLVDRITPDVEAIGALNTIVIEAGVTVGHNTDVTGFGSALRDGLPAADLEQVVLLGAGGAGTAVAHALVRLGAQRLVVFDTDPTRAERLARSIEQLQTDIDVSSVLDSGLPDALSVASGLVNATPVGMAAHPGTPVSADLLRPALWVADIVYRPLVTELLRDAGAAGCRTLSGAGMAVHQAADAFELITGRPAHREAMFRDLDDMVAVEVESKDNVLNQPREISGERKQ
ncbi:MAG: shikimate dehydrogenase [Nocardioidaceae bacterium]